MGQTIEIERTSSPASRRGGLLKGEKNNLCTIPDATIAEIVAAHERGERGKDIVARFGVSPAHVSALRHGTRRVTVSRRPTGRSDRRVSDAAARKVYRLAHSGALSQAQIASACGVTRTMVADIKRGVTYASVTGHRR